MMRGKWLRDTIERTLASYAEYVVGFYATVQITNAQQLISNLEIALYAGIPTALVVLKSSIASLIGKPESASLDPGV